MTEVLFQNTKLVNNSFVSTTMVRSTARADSDESGHLFQSISDTIPILSDSCRSEATL